MTERAATVVYLIRHGATAANREIPYRLLGRGLDLDLPLDDVGLDQARRASDVLRTTQLAAVYTSPLARARATANLIAEPHALDVIPVDALIEADLGSWEGLTWDQARRQFPDHHAAFLAHPGTIPYPGGESFLDAGNRVVPAVAGLAAAHPGRSIAVVGHNVTHRALLATLLGVPIDLARQLRQSNGGISVVKYADGSAVVDTLNSTFHLAAD